MDSPSYNIYSIASTPIDEYIELFKFDILPSVRCSQIDSTFVEYVRQNIEPIGWQAIWRSVPKSSSLKVPLDFLVEVCDVSQTKLEAVVFILKGLPKPDGMLDAETKTELSKLMATSNVAVPLLELYPVVDDESEGLFERTAEIIEHVRFFYDNLWRPWDDDDEDDCVFVDHYLEPRIKVYYDILANLIPSSIAEQMQCILNEAWENYRKLQELENDMQINDSDHDLNEVDVCKCMELRWKQDQLKRELNILENPTMRTLVIQKELAIKPFPNGKRQDDPAVLHIVSAKLYAKMCQNVPPSTVIEHHVSFATAVSSAYEGDLIWIYPGRYICEGLGWLEDGIAIEGKGEKPEDVVVEAKGNSDIFINCNAEKVHLNNVTIEAGQGQHSAIMVHGGRADLSNCIINNGNIGISVKANATVKIENCTISRAQLCGINVDCLASVTVRNSRIQAFPHCGIAVKFDENIPGDRSRVIQVTGNKIDGKGKCGIAFYKSDKTLNSLGNLELLAKPSERFAETDVRDNTFNPGIQDISIEE